MADEQVDFPIEMIPDAASVFMRAHRDFFVRGELQPGVFRNRQGAMSVDWDKYSNAEQTRDRARSNPLDNAVISMRVGGMRAINSLDVVHVPLEGNQAHSESVLPADETLTETRVHLLRLSVMEIPLASAD